MERLCSSVDTIINYFQNFVGTVRSFPLTTLHRCRYELDSSRLQIFLSKRIQSFRDDRVTTLNRIVSERVNFQNHNKVMNIKVISNSRHT